MRPGIVSKTQDGKIQCQPIYSRIISLFAEQNELQYAVPGGLIGEASGVLMHCMCVCVYRNIMYVYMYFVYRNVYMGTCTVETPFLVHNFFGGGGEEGG